MSNQRGQMVIVGAGINGLVAANYAVRNGWQVTQLERATVPGGACVSATAQVAGFRQDYALGASVLGLMQDFVWEETGLAQQLHIWAPDHPKLVHFPGDDSPTWIYREPERLDREFRERWGEQGDLKAFRADEARVVEFIQQGFRQGHPPSLTAARASLGETLTSLWITGSARALLDHYLTADGTKMYMAMTVTESGPVSLSEPGSAFVIPMMDSGTVFDGYYGFVRGGIWQITSALARINRQLGVDLRLNAPVDHIDLANRSVHIGQARYPFDELVMATDPVTAARLVDDEALQDHTAQQRVLGSAGKLNLMFREPVRWKHGSGTPQSDAAFRFSFAVNTLDEFEAATLAVLEDDVVFAPGYFQIYCEGAAMRHMGLQEPFDRLAVFFKNLALGETGESLRAVEAQVRDRILELTENPQDLAWTRLLTPRDLQQTFGFPGGNLEHTMLVNDQLFKDRGYSLSPKGRFYRFGNLESVSICGSSTYPCGSVAGTPGYLCVAELIRHRP